MNRGELLPDGPDLVAISTNEAGGFINEWDDGTHSAPTISIEDAVARHQRARTVALRSTFFKRKR